eukprot:COSAG02_NODE_36258_length_457_cov_0.662011_1_plen_68_part_10
MVIGRVKHWLQTDLSLNRLKILDVRLRAKAIHEEIRLCSLTEADQRTTLPLRLRGRHHSPITPPGGTR